MNRNNKGPSASHNKQNAPKSQAKKNHGSTAGSKSGQGIKTVSVPLAQSSSFDADFRIAPSPRFKDAVRVHGREFLAFVLSPAAPIPGMALINLPVSPADWQGTRMELFSRMYEKYLFRKLKFTYIPAVASTTPGALILAYDRDPSDATPPSGASGVRQYMAWANTRVGDVKTRLDIECPLMAPDSGYYVNDIPGGDERLSDQGQVYVAVLVAPTANIALGSLIVEYECEFFIPNLELQSPIDISVSTSSPTTSTTDLLAKVAVGTLSLATDPQYKPVVDALGKYFIRLAEGLYRANVAGVTPSATNGLQAPTLTPLEPKIAPAPQATAQVVSAIPAPAPGNYIYDYLFNVPSGGADLRWNAINELAADTTKFTLEKVSKGYFTGALNNFV